MREIKFRMPIFDLTGEFDSFHYWGFDEEMNFTNPAGSVYETNKEFRKTQEQYSGLKDENNKEIYFDSDIVKATITDDHTGEQSFMIGMLYLNTKRFRITIRGHENFNLMFADELEVIGNIHQNPELINK